MKIGVVGPGAIGLLFTFYLKKHGANVTLYTKDQGQATILRETGVTCVRNGEIETVFPNVLPLECMRKERDDYIFIAVKQYHLEYVLPYIETGTRLVFLQNGMAHLHLLENMKEASIAVGIVEHGAKKECAGVVEHMGIGVTKFGIVTGELVSFEPILDCFFTGDFPALLERDWKEMMLKKLVVNACINPLTALLRVPNGELVTNASYNMMMKQVFHEVISVLDDAHEEDLWNLVCAVCEKTSRNTSSMLADVQHNRKTEIDAIVGYIMQQGYEQRKVVPTLTMLYHFIKAFEA